MMNKLWNTLYKCLSFLLFLLNKHLRKKNCTKISIYLFIVYLYIYDHLFFFFINVQMFSFFLLTQICVILYCNNNISNDLSFHDIYLYHDVIFLFFDFEWKYFFLNVLSVSLFVRKERKFLRFKFFRET